MGKPAGLPDTEPDRYGNGADIQFYRIGHVGRLAIVSGVFPADKYSDTDLYYRIVHLPDAGTEKSGADLYYLIGIYRVDIVLYQR